MAHANRYSSRAGSRPYTRTTHRCRLPKYNWTLGCALSLALIVALFHGAPAYGACPGDVNADSVVDGADVAVLVDQFGTTNCTLPQECTADIDADGDVDDADVQRMAHGLGSTGCAAQTEVSGVITSDTTWTLAGSPYIVTGNITVQAVLGDDSIPTLTIEPGVEVRFNAHLFLSVTRAYGGSPGALVAQGTEAAPIVFTSNASEPAAGDWAGIKFSYDSPSVPSQLVYCTIRYAGYSSGPGSIDVAYASPTISHITVEYGNGFDLYLNTYNAVGTVSDSTFNSGIYYQWPGTVEFSGNTFNQNNARPTLVSPANVHGLVNGNTFANVDADSAIVVFGNGYSGGAIYNDANWTAAIPYAISNNLAVQGTDGEDGVTTMTIEPGAILKFTNPIAGIQILNGSALSAQGTPDNMILFTSGQNTPLPGDWSGFQFGSNGNASQSALTYSVVEYAGYGNDAALGVQVVSPAIHHNVIRFTSGPGLSIYAGGHGANIDCNTFYGNSDGISLNAATPVLQYNNFAGNADAGVRNLSVQTISAENNWWGDPDGPNQAGDAVIGNVDADPWSTVDHQCIVPSGQNHPPHTPHTPLPADGAVRVSLNADTINFKWAGGDPDIADVVTYHIHCWGNVPEGFSETSPPTRLNQYQVSGLVPGQTYQWQVVAQDDLGLSTSGPIWQFTIDGDPPDLVISNVTTTPGGNLQNGQGITLTAFIENIGSGPAVDPFSVDLSMGGTALAPARVDAIIHAGQSHAVTWQWTYAGGDPAIDVHVDSSGEVAETDEANNTYSALLLAVADNAAPALIGTSPEDGAFRPQLQRIEVTLSDTQSAVNDAAVMASFRLTGSNQQAIAGSLWEVNDTFIFVPDTLPLTDGHYQVAITAEDIHGNSQGFPFGFSIDATAPGKPVITGGTVTSGTLAPRPVQNTTNQFNVSLTGTRDVDTEVWLNGEIIVDRGDADWSVTLVLQPGDNTFEIWLQDRTANRGESQWVDIRMTATNTVYYDYDATGRVKTIHSNP